MFSMLLQQGLSPNAAVDGCSLLHLALMSNQMFALVELLQRGAKVRKSKEHELAPSFLS